MSRKPIANPLIKLKGVTVRAEEDIVPFDEHLILRLPKNSPITEAVRECVQKREMADLSLFFDGILMVFS
jgi:hypothetical protein